MRNREEQDQEIFALLAIFPDMVRVLDQEQPVRRVQVKLACDVELQFDLLPTYPLSSPPKHHICTPAFMYSLQHELQARLQRNYEDFGGGPLICQCIADLQAALHDYKTKSATKAEEATPQTSRQPDGYAQTDHKAVEKNDFKATNQFNWTSGPCLEDRKSVFQAHITDVHSKEEAMRALAELRQHSKIARATHNIYAYVVQLASGVELSDCEDDGETKAGAKLLHMLRLMGMRNQMVVVTRWYGGVHLGPDRFRHICNVARELLVDYRQKQTVSVVGNKRKK